MYCFFSGKEKLGVAFLILGAFCIRLFMITLDPFLHEWDERFHALVAKNMMDNPWVPMLRANPVLPYDYQSWCCNHIWLHKQPQFLWQMALSMKLFGVNEVAMRLPSAIMGTIGVWMVYRIGHLWLKDKAVAYIGAMLFALSYYQLQHTSGATMTDHNDVAFGFYVLASIWAYVEYRTNLHKPYPWLVLLGLLVGFAVLNKWLTGLLVFAGWGSMLLLQPEERKTFKNWLHMALALAVAVIVFLPWQIYTTNAFPLESAWEHAYNLKHIFETIENHKGNAWFHVVYMLIHYGITLLPFMAAGLVLLFVKGWHNRPHTIEMLVMMVVVYLFFSQVKTKIPAFTFVVAPILFLVTSYGLMVAYNWAANRIPRAFLAMAFIAIVLFAFRPWTIIEKRSLTNEGRNNKLHNTQIFKEVGQALTDDYVVFNCSNFEDVEMMFYTGLNAYAWYPQVTQIDSLLAAGHKIAVFKGHGIYQLPGEIQNHPGVVIIDKQLQ